MHIYSNSSLIFQIEIMEIEDIRSKLRTQSINVKMSREREREMRMYIPREKG